ncbi:hypothetical protein AHF37_06767 [Paragonimus kellicotti]|nr:hypothetical protein AHF37_06767 [Paragonimus kellicotti]
MESSSGTRSVLYGGCSGILLGCCDFLYRSDPKRGVLVGLVTAFSVGYITNLVSGDPKRGVLVGLVTAFSVGYITNLVYRMKTLKISGGSPISYWDYKKSIDRMLSERRCT